MHQSLTALINSVFSFLYRTAIFVAVILLCFHFLVLSATPSVVVSSAQQVDNAQSVNVLLDDVYKVLNQKQFAHDITISKAQGQSLLGFMQRAYPSFSGNIHFNQDIGVVEMSIKVPQWIVPRYMNIQLILNSNSYVDIEGLKVGKIPLPGNALLKIATWLVNTYTRSSIATQAQTQINEVRFSPDNVFVSILPMKQFLNDLKVVRDSIDFGGDPSLGLRINHYLNFLMNEQSVPKSRFNSLTGKHRARDDLNPAIRFVFVSCVFEKHIIQLFSNALVRKYHSKVLNLDSQNYGRRKSFKKYCRKGLNEPCT